MLIVFYVKRAGLGRAPAVSKRLLDEIKENVDQEPSCRGWRTQQSVQFKGLATVGENQGVFFV